MPLEIIIGVAVAVVGAGGIASSKWMAGAISDRVLDQIGDRLEPRIVAAVQRETEPLHGTVHKVEKLLHETRDDLARHLPPDGAAFENGATTAVESLNEGYRDRREIKARLERIERAVAP